MKKKIWVLIFMICLLTGCKANYTLSYKDNVFTEEIKITNYIPDNEATDLPRIEDLKSNGYYADYDETFKYEQNIVAKGNTYDISLKAKYDASNYSHSNILHSCFEFYDFKETDEYYYISAYGNFYCQYSDNTTVKFMSKNAVLYHNASKAKNGTYTWNLNKMDHDKMEIRLQLSKKTYLKKNKFSLFWFTVYLLLGITAVIGYQKYQKDPTIISKTWKKFVNCLNKQIDRK